tara:strand:+ start:1170 stop:2018 length:849 start_codon:yes stop_codon:yes gene_type:complete
MKKDLNEFSLELLWLFLKEKLYKIIIIVLVLYIPSAFIIYKNSPENWIVEASVVENSDNISKFINEKGEFKSTLKIEFVLDDFFEIYSKFLALELNKNLDQKLEYQLGSEEVRLKLNSKFFYEIFQNKYWLEDYWRSRGIKVSKEDFISEYNKMNKNLMLAAEMTLSDFQISYEFIGDPSVIKNKVKAIKFNFSTNEITEEDIKKIIDDINISFQNKYNKNLRLAYNINSEIDKNFDLMQIKLSKIEKTSMKIINIFKLLFVIFLSVYVLYFIFYFRKAIKF